MPTLLLVTADEPVRDLLSDTISSLGLQVAVAPDASAAFRTTVSVRLDALFLDTAAVESVRDFIDSLFAITGRLPVTFIAAAAARWAPGSLPLDPSLDQLLVKPFTAAQSRSALDAVLAAVPSLTADRPRAAALLLDHHTLQARSSGFAATLTPTEFRLLEYLAVRRGAVVTCAELLEKVWGFAAGTGSREVVRSHVRNLRAKLRDGGFDPIETLPRRGYRLSPPGAPR